ncbi:MAG: hypothetical protein ACPGPF_02545 [Pontibacterium sp.]
MALFKQNRGDAVDPFADLLFNTLITFTFLFLVALMLINPPAKSGIIDPKAEFIITVSWPDLDPNDIDIWMLAPDETLVSYVSPQRGLIHLDRDDRGMVNDTQEINGQTIINPLNQEVLTIRGRPPGEYILNLHYFKTENEQPVPVTVYLAEVNPSLKVLNYSTTTLTQVGEEATALRFTITPHGAVTDINRLQKNIIEAHRK